MHAVRGGGARPRVATARTSSARGSHGERADRADGEAWPRAPHACPVLCS
jgi:hypothetical protein